MFGLKRVLCCFVLFLSATVNQADAWHGYGFGGHCFTGRGYGFGLNHHSFHPGWSSYSRASYYSSYGYGGLGYGGLSYGGLGYGGLGYGGLGYGGLGYGGLGYSSISYRGYWPWTSYNVSYRSYAPVYYPTPTYYVPTCYPISYSTYYTPYVAPIIYSNVYSGFPSCAVTPSTSSLAVAAYAVRKPVTNSAAFRVASQPAQQANPQQFPLTQSPAGRYVLAPTTSSAALDTAPEDIIAAADAILAAGGYRQAAQAYAQIVVQYGNSDRLVTRRFIAQVANGDYDQAAVVVELAIANGNRLDRSDLPKGDLKVALRDFSGLITSRGESLAANALQKPEDAVPMLTVAHWMALNGDDERAELFKARAEQMQQVAVGKLIHKPSMSPNATN